MLSQVHLEVHLVLSFFPLALREMSTDVLRHLMPAIDVLSAAAGFADALAEVRLVLDNLAKNRHGSMEIQPYTQ